MNARVTATMMIPFLLKIMKIDKFLRPGFYASGVGDLIIQLSADVLRVPIVALLCAQDMDVSVHFPSKRQLSVSPIIVAYQAEGRGHLDGTLKEDFDDLARPGMCA